ncbi:FecCD family ABC transporter permease [Embleya scabrispora]|uniref:FecCD family ABC transporter permease n=1 Tax=Embleya scabrispora TaxID=159449 RepID=UPI000369001B|nr:iron chelate uptake ABC transporter family permease subunit [Embleya scabrispora]MYS86086.1 iron chelate uptake ABC transporter family permease subunit [Streptomyces sp. SID5474]
MKTALIKTGRPTPRVVRWERGPLGFAVRPRTLVAVVVLVAVVFAGLIASLALGDYPLAWRDVVTGLFGAGPADAELVVHELRLPRALVGMLAGLALGMSGAVFQAVTRNPLAGPDLIGITAGAGAGAVLAILLGGVSTTRSTTYGAVPLGALIGALATAAVIHLLAFRGGTISGYGFVLVGIAVNGMLAASTRWMLARVDIGAATRATSWLTGSLDGREYAHVRWLGYALVVLVPATVALARPYRMLQFDDDTAASLGMPVTRSRIALLVLATALTAAATACAGPVVFVALAAPQIARRLAGTPGLPLVVSGLVGAALVVLADLVARTAFPTELPVGIVTGAVGAPYLLWLLARNNRAGKGG